MRLTFILISITFAKPFLPNSKLVQRCTHITNVIAGGAEYTTGWGTREFAGKDRVDNKNALLD